MQSRLTGLIVVCALALLPLSAAAHHGWAGNGDEEFEITGTLAGPVELCRTARDDEDQSQGRTGLGSHAGVGAADQERRTD